MNTDPRLKILTFPKPPPEPREAWQEDEITTPIRFVRVGSKRFELYDAFSDEDDTRTRIRMRRQ